MTIADDVKAALSTLSLQIDQELASHLATASMATAANDVNAAALADALATVKALSGKLPPLPIPDVVEAPTPAPGV